MNLRSALAGALIAALAGCSTLHSQQTPPAPAAATAPTTAPAPPSATPESATTSAAGSNSQLSSSALAEQQRKAAEQLAAQQQEAAERASLSQRVVHFDYDQSTIHPDDQTLLTAHAAYLSKHPSAHVRLTGHTDERGTAEYNMALGERRAKAVQAFLTLHGVQAGQLDVVSFGKEEPVDPGHTEAAWAKNRRVELHYQSDAP